MTNYDELVLITEHMFDGIKYDITILSNASAILNEYLEEINWVGFYILKGDELLLGPFQGKVACTNIKVGSGVCGTTIKENKTIVVDDVHKFKGHIACDSRSLSEICIPLHNKDNSLYGLLDIDSPILNRFKEIDINNLEKIAKFIENALNNI